MINLANEREHKHGIINNISKTSDHKQLHSIMSCPNNKGKVETSHNPGLPLHNEYNWLWQHDICNTLSIYSVNSALENRVTLYKYISPLSIRGCVHTRYWSMADKQVDSGIRLEAVIFRQWGVGSALPI